MTGAPLLSVVVVVHRMPRQAENTLYSLSPHHQVGVDVADYEIVVVEQESDRMLGRERAEAVAPNVRYLSRPSTGVSPVPAVVLGLEHARGAQLGIVIDGARMVTPRVVQYAMAAHRITPRSVVIVPGYHLGAAEQHTTDAHDEATEEELLDAIDWRRDGYRLFAVSVFFKGRHQRGYLLPLMESNALFCSRADMDAIGGMDERFDMPGGGLANLDLYRRLAELPGTEWWVLPGEGTFHQYHGGVTTVVDADREAKLASFRAQYERIRGREFLMPERRPRLLGAVTGWAMPMLQYSATAVLGELVE